MNLSILDLITQIGPWLREHRVELARLVDLFHEFREAETDPERVIVAVAGFRVFATLTPTPVDDELGAVLDYVVTETQLLDWIYSLAARDVPAAALALEDVPEAAAKLQAGWLQRLLDRLPELIAIIRLFGGFGQ